LDAKEITPKSQTERIPSGDLNYLVCINCCERLVWRPGEDGLTLVAWCTCKQVYTARPLHHRRMFLFRMKKADMMNVRMISDGITFKK
jgi:hypothetical protein